MKVFISWSGEVSHDVAVALREWLPSVLQSVEPYVSSEDVEKGARWTAEIGRQLDDTSFGILCVTRQNLDSSWLNFEAGALSKSVDVSRVSPFLLDIRQAELVGPLSQFQATLPRLDDIVRLVKSINAMSERPIEQTRLANAAKMWWPRLEKELKAALSEQGQVQQQPERGVKEMIEELLEISRGMQRQLMRGETEELRTSRDSPSPSRTQFARRLAQLELSLIDTLDKAGVETRLITKLDNALRLRLDAMPSQSLVNSMTEISNRYAIPIQVIFSEGSGSLGRFRIEITPDIGE
jgi:hypothetical protein